MTTFAEKLQPILDMLASRAWKNAAPDQDGDFLLYPSDVARGTDVESLREALEAMYRHARRWAPGLDVPFFVPPVHLGVTGLAGNFVVDGESYATVGVAPDLLDNTGVVLATLAHEACHHILRQSDLSRVDDVALDEITTDLAMFVCGFGELALLGHSHVVHVPGGDRRAHLGYLSPEEIRQAHEHVLARRVALGLPARSTRGKRRGGPARPAAPGALAADGTLELRCGEALCKRAFRATLRREGKPWPVQCPVCGVHLYPGDVLRSASAHELEPQRAELRLPGDGHLVEVTSAVLLRLAQPADAPPAPAPEARKPAPEPSSAVAEVDGAAILAEMIEAASQAMVTESPAPGPAPASALDIPAPVLRSEKPAPVSRSEKPAAVPRAETSAPAPRPDKPAHMPHPEMPSRRRGKIPSIAVIVVALVVVLVLVTAWLLLRGSSSAASSASTGSSGVASSGLPEGAAGGPAPSVAVTGGPGGAASGGPVPSSSGGMLSSPPWPAGTEKIAISWVLHPSRRDADQVERKHVDLVLRAGATLRVFPVEVTSTFMVVMSRQALCHRHGAVSAQSKEVASLELMGGGFTTIDVRRATETSLEIAEIYETCGACDQVPGQADPCPPQRRVLGHIEIPRGVSFTERILEVEVEQRGGGKPGFREVPRECDPVPEP